MKESTKNQAIIWGSALVMLFVASRLNFSGGINLSTLSGKIPEFGAAIAAAAAMFKGSRGLLHQDPPTPTSTAQDDGRIVFSQKLHWLTEYARSTLTDDEMVQALNTVHQRFTMIRPDSKAKSNDVQK